MKFLTRILVLLMISSFIVACGSGGDSKPAANENQDRSEVVLTTVERLTQDGFFEELRGVGYRFNLIVSDVTKYISDKNRNDEEKFKLSDRIRDFLAEVKNLFLDYQDRVKEVNDLPKVRAKGFYEWQKRIVNADLNEVLKYSSKADQLFRNASSEELNDSISLINNIAMELSKLIGGIFVTELSYIEAQIHELMHFWPETRAIHTAKKITKGDSTINKEAFINKMNTYFTKANHSFTYVSKFMTTYYKIIFFNNAGTEKTTSSELKRFYMDYCKNSLSLKHISSDVLDIHTVVRNAQGEVTRFAASFIRTRDKLDLNL